MKPGNLSLGKRCQIRRQTRDEDSILRTSNPGVRFFYFGPARKNPDRRTAALSARLCTMKPSKYTEYSFGFHGLI